VAWGGEGAGEGFIVFFLKGMGQSLSKYAKLLLK